MFRQYGFNLNLSNHIPLLRTVPDLRNPACKARKWPPLDLLPKASVIIIFYNEPLSSLLRNVVGVLNRSPPELLGEVLLVDDHSALDELKYLDEHLERLRQKLPPGKVRLVRRDVHDGIVGARNAGARAALYPVIVILDSHAEVAHGWLEPLVARIYGDRTRVVVPNIVPININTMHLDGGGTWPPSRGSFNWRLSFTILAADPVYDLVEKDVDKTSSGVKTPVMPGGLFAMDREYYFELGAYDPEIRFYGAEHVEMSLRVWMCGGSMETCPCSHIGHIYREFDRFGVDTQLRGVNIGAVLDRNDGRVAEVWLDEYKEIFFKFRPRSRRDLGDLEPRREIRRKLQCKSFKWFLDEVCRDMYIPDPHAVAGHLASPDGQQCVDNGGSWEGPVKLQPCASNGDPENKRLEFTAAGYLQFSEHFDHKLICVRIQTISQVPCQGAPTWEVEDRGHIRSVQKPGQCLDRGSPGGDMADLQPCASGSAHQRWLFQRKAGGAGTLSDLDGAICVDNMQRSSGPPGLYGCHGGGTQQWVLDAGRLRSVGNRDGVCLGFSAVASIATCMVDDPGFQWRAEGPAGRQILRPLAAPDFCLGRDASGSQAVMEACREAAASQLWRIGH